MTEKQQIKMVIFDWAGTTTDFGSQAPVDVFDRTFRQKGLVFTKAEINAPMGMEKKAHIKTMLLPKKAKSFGKMLTAAAGTRTILKMFTSALKATCALLLPNTANLFPA